MRETEYLKQLREEMKRNRVRYIRNGTIPNKIAPGRVLMHNHVEHGPDWSSGINGFRAWTANKPYKGFLPCPCGYAGLKHYAAREHVKAWRDPQTRKAVKRRVRAEERRLGMGAGDGSQHGIRFRSPAP